MRAKESHPKTAHGKVPEGMQLWPLVFISARTHMYLGAALGSNAKFAYVKVNCSQLHLQSMSNNFLVVIG